MAKETDDKVILLPEGRLINEALFERDVFKSPNGTEGEPKYKVELAFDPDTVEGEGTVEDDLMDAIEDAFGGPAVDDKATVFPLLVGDKLAAKREAKGKEGDAYKGMTVIRADTKFNMHGQDAPGGVQVFNEDCEPVIAANRHEIYPGCYGIAAVKISTYTTNQGDAACKFYLSAFQKTRDGDKLVSSADHSKLFKPVGRSKTEGGEGKSRRRSRKG